ncbi:MAG: hypothetical protein PHU01_12430 [Desulfuromonadaceae bacterium]|nr:hypothetical protein [Desulfuromonadaceae bacterium]
MPPPPFQLPIENIIPEILDTVQISNNTILNASPGAGKTTRVPLALLDIIPPEAGRILMLEPRRIAAVAAAGWMAAALNEEVGQSVGIQSDLTPVLQKTPELK